MHPKIGFHTGSNCNCGGIEKYWQSNKDNGIPFGLYSAAGGGIAAIDGPKYGADWIIYRNVDEHDYVPYTVQPTAELARKYWDQFIAALPPEVRENKAIWLEIFNEPSKEPKDAERVFEWLWYLAQCAMEDGRKLCGPGWASGTPEPSAWKTLWAEKWLQLCAELRGQFAVTIHEYSYDAADIRYNLGYHLGRFRFIHEACDSWGITRPTIFVTECGWTLDNMPEPEQAMTDIDFIAKLYNGYENIKFAFLWTLVSGGDKVSLAGRLNAAIPAVTEYMKTELPDTKDPVLVLDISKWQHPIKPAVMKQKGVDGIIPRLSYGTWEDERVREYVPALREAAVTVPLGYHYYHPFQGWREQYDTMTKVMRDLGIKRLAVDLEDTTFTKGLLEDGDDEIDLEVLRRDNLESVSGTESLLQTVQPKLVADVKAFMEQLEIDFPAPKGWEGPWHGIYTNLNYWSTIMGSPAWGSRYFLWLAAWTTATRPIVPRPWTRWTLWQHSSSGVGKDHGVGSARVDLNRFNGDMLSWVPWANVDNLPEEPTTPVEEELFEFAIERSSFDVEPGKILLEEIVAAGYQAVTTQLTTVLRDKFYTMQLGVNAKTGQEKLWYYVGVDFANIKTYSPTVAPPPPPPPVVPPVPEPAKNYITNWSFEGGHTDGETGQVPNEWDVEYDSYAGGMANPFDPDQVHSRFVKPETNVKRRVDIPANEQSTYILDGDKTFKMFCRGAFRARMTQVVTNLGEGTYQLVVPVFVDAVMRYDGPAKVWADDPRSCLVRVKYNNGEIALGSPAPWKGYIYRGNGEQWFALQPGSTNYVMTTFYHKGGDAKIVFHVMMPFALKSNGVFIDAVELHKVTPPAPPPATPPTTPKYDLRPAFKPVQSAQGAYGPFMVLQHNDGRTEDVQYYVRGAHTFLIKNRNYEHIIVSELTDGIFRDEDTSQSDATFYRLREPNGGVHRWLPNHMAIGEVYKRVARVTQYKKENCAAIATYDDTTYAKLVEHRSVADYAGRKVCNVVTILFGKNPSTIDNTWFEKHVYALGDPKADGRTDIRGLVEYQSATQHSYLVDVPAGRDNMTYKIVCE